MRTAALAAALAVVVGAAPMVAPAVAADEPRLVNEELVVAQVDASGLPTEVTLYSRVSARDYPEGPVRDPSSTTEVEYVDRRGSPDTDGGDVIVDVGGGGRTSVTTRATFDKPLPVALHAEYRQGPRVLDPDAVDEASGQMRVTYTVTNTTATRRTVRYRDASGRWSVDKQPVFAPFVGALVATLPAGTDLLQAPGAVRATTADGRTQLTWDLVLYPPIGDYTQTVSMVADADPLGVPGVRLKVIPVTPRQSPTLGFSTDLLAASVEGNVALAEGMEELDAAVAGVADGAAALTRGLRELGRGTEALSRQVDSALVPGASQVADGATQLAEGQRGAAKGTAALAEGQAAAAEGATSAVDGARELQDGAAQLSDGLLSLFDGVQELLKPDALPDARDGAGDLGEAVLRLRDVIGSGSDPDGPFPPNSGSTLVQAVRAATKVSGVSQAGAAAVVGNLEEIAKELGTLAAQAGTAATAAGSAELQAGLVYQQACGAAPVLTQAQCRALQQAVADAGQARQTAADVGLGTGAQAARVGAQAVAVTVIAEALKGVAAALVAVEEALTRVSVALVSGNADSPGVYEGLVALTDGLTATIQGLARLSNGAAESASGAAALTDGTQEFGDGLDELAKGAVELAEGSRDLARGSAELAEGGDALAQGSQLQAEGTEALGRAITDLDEGVDAAGSGADRLSDGADQVQEEGTSEILAEIVEASRDPAFARAYLKATHERARDALPYGPPRGAAGHIAYVYIMEGSDEVPRGTNSFAAWTLMVVLALAAAVLAWRRLHPAGAGPQAGAPDPFAPHDDPPQAGGPDPFAPHDDPPQAGAPDPFAPHDDPPQAGAPDPRVSDDDWFFRPPDDPGRGPAPAN
jgi:putative membrane protein